MSVQPNDLLDGSNCVECVIPHGLQRGVIIYLLAVIAGVDPDPQQLMAAASGIYGTVPEGMMPSIKTMLLCQIANT